MPAVINEVSTFSNIPAFVPFGVLYYTQDTSDLYIGTGNSSGPAVTFVSGPSAGNVTSVAGKTGAVTLAFTDINSTATRAQMPSSASPTTTFPGGITSLNVYGDSISFGFGLQNSKAGWQNLFAQAVGLPIGTNFATSGALINQAGLIVSAYGVSPSTSVGSLSLLGANDLTFSIANAANLTVLQNAYMAFAAWLAIPNANKVLDASITYSGAWSSFSEFGLTGHFSNTIGNTATATVSGTAVYIAGWASGGYGSMDVTVDGVSQGNFVLAPAGNTLGGAIYPFAFRVPGLSAGSHTVVATVHSAAFVTVQWMAGNAGASAFVGLGNTIPRTGFTAGQVTSLNTQISTVATGLATDGLNVFYVDDNSVMSLSATPLLYQGTNIHPNIAGHLLIADKWFTTFYSLPSFPAYTGKNGDLLAQILNTAGVTPSKLAMYLNQVFDAAQIGLTAPTTLTWDVGGTFGNGGGAPGTDIDLGLSRGASLTLYIGNGSAGNATGSLGLTNIIQVGKTTTYNNIATVSNGVPSELATVDLTGQTAPIAASTLYTPAATGMFRISAYLKITTAGTSPALGPLTITYTDGTDSVAQSVVMHLQDQTGAGVTSNSGNSTTSVLSGSLVAFAKTGVAIQYAVALTGTVGTGAYEVHLKCEAL
jgi:hypothetical protein